MAKQGTIALIVTVEKEHNQYNGQDDIRVTGQFAYANEEGKWRNFSQDDWRNVQPRSPMDLDHLQVYAQGNSGMRDSGLFAWHLNYHDIYSLELGQAEKVVKGLKYAARKLAEYEAADGHPSTFGHYVQRVCRAVGASMILTQGRAARNGWSHDHMDYAEWTVKEGRYRLERVEEEWRNPQAKETSSAVAVR